MSARDGLGRSSRSADASIAAGENPDTGRVSIGPGALLVGDPLGFHRLRRRHLVTVLGMIGVFWLCVVLAGAISQSAAANDRTAALRDANLRAEADLEATRRELVLVRSAPFRELQARAYGMGKPGERAFALAPGASPLPSIRPLGADADETAPSPLEDWLSLLFDPNWSASGTASLTDSR